MSHAPSFRGFSEVTSDAVPTLVGYDPSQGGYVIGESARQLGLSGRPVAEGFKRYLGDGDAAFEGRPTTAVPRPRAWSLGAPLSEASNLSTRKVAQVFLEQLFGQTPEIPKQLIVGVPAIRDEGWQNAYRRHIRQLLMGMGQEEPLFFPEPFAVFQFYRHAAKLVPESRGPLSVLVVDFGGGTFDCCGVETTQEGNLARGGSTAVPLGVNSVEGAGKEVDLRLLARAISAINDIRLKKESLESRIRARPGILLIAEEMKIALSAKMKHCRLEDNCSQSVERRNIPAGFFHPDVAFELCFSGEDLKSVVTHLWMERLGEAIRKTINEAKFLGGTLHLTRLDKIVLAGGSSALPFLPQLIAKTIAGQDVDFRPEDIVVGRDCEKAVAYGLAIEAREQRNRALKTHNSIGPCVFGRLFLYVAPGRDAPFQKPFVKRLQDGRECPQDSGLLLGGPMRIGEFTVDFECKLPFPPKGSLFYWFCDKEAPENPGVQRLNLLNDVLRVPPDVHKVFRLQLRFLDDGFVQPVFRFDGKELRVPPFDCTALQVAREAESYAGVDIGTSNSYVVNLWAEVRPPRVKYPAFTISDSAGARLRALEQRIADLRAAGTLTAQSCRDLAERRKSDFVFHSIKIEGSGLTRGETDELLGGGVATTREMAEPVNVRQAYEFVLASHSSYREQPEGFLREINRVALKDLHEGAGAYRVGPVKITGTEFEPPAAGEVRPYMEKLGAELADGPGDRSIVHFAAEMHSKLVAIHPFVDGNGRTARLLMNAIMLDAGLPPSIINFQDKERYLDCLLESNRGDLSPMVTLIAETVEASLQELEVPKQPPTEPLAAEEPAPPPVEARPTSERLAEIMRKRIARLSADRHTRYEAWRAGFDAFREEVRSRCSNFNTLYANTPYQILYTPFDTLPFEKWESLLRGAMTPNTWLLGTELSSESRRERFVFFFQSLSDQFRTLAQGGGFAKSVGSADVTLTVARWSDGMPHPLRDEPIKLREIGYFQGQFLFLVCDAAGTLTVEGLPAAVAFDNFLADVVEAFL